VNRINTPEMADEEILRRLLALNLKGMDDRLRF
jgi:hypothetical protein